MPSRAVFLDRDGVIVRDVDLMTRRDQVELSPQAPQALHRLREVGFRLVVVSNQTVVARGLASEEDVNDIHDWIQHLLQPYDVGIDRFYFCPHHPSATLPQYRVDCDCRKPRPGMLQCAAEEMNLDLPASFMVGDRPSDVIAGWRAGCRTILVETGKHTEPFIESGDMLEYTAEPDYTCPDLTAAVDYIIEKL